MINQKSFYSILFTFLLSCMFLDVNGQSIPSSGDSNSFQNHSDPNAIYKTVEQKPEFPGGQDKLFKFLASNIEYPKNAKKNNIVGRVVAQFVVTKSGVINNIQITRSLSPECDAEVIRVIKAMPTWKPGTQSGKPVNVYYTLPVSFKLQ